MEESCTDRLDALLNHFPVRAHLFHAGSMCRITDFAAPNSGGQMHLVRAGSLEVIHSGRDTIRAEAPCLLLYPRQQTRRFVVDAETGADLVCAQLDFHGGNANPIAAALPDVLCLPLANIEGAAPALEMLFAEASGTDCGRHPLIDRLFDIVLIHVLRHLIETTQIQSGLLAGLAHPRLRRALVTMHEQPAQEWSLDALASACGMSRSVFANTFRDTVGCTPGAYLQSWRVRLTQQSLLQGQALKIIAVDVGYGSEAALSRAFRAVCGVTPREWRQSQSAGYPGGLSEAINTSSSTVHQDF